MALLKRSNLAEFLNERSDALDGALIDGDPAYGILPWIMSGYKGRNISD
jgi:hypothetical protein